MSSSSADQAPPPLKPGDGFRVRGVTGDAYACRLLRREGVGGWIVRLEDGRIARLDPSRLLWSTWEKIGRGSVLEPGDEVIVETAANTVRGELVEVTEDEVALRLEDDWDVRLPLASVKAITLLFRAADLRPGDCFWVNSVSGREYRGTVVEVQRDRIKVALASGEPLDLRLRRLNMDTLLVSVPVELDPS